MRKLTLILILSAILFGCDNNCSNSVFSMNHGVYLKTETYYTEESKDNSISQKYAYNNRVDVNYKFAEFHSDIELYKIKDEPDKMKNISLPYIDKSSSNKTDLEENFQINSLYGVINLGDYVSIYHGAIPFRGGKFSEIKDQTVNGGNGLPIINNQVYTSDFVSFHSSKYSDYDFSFIIGNSKFESKNNYNGLLTKNDQSSGTYLIGKCESGKHFFEVDGYDMNVKIESLDYARLQILGFGYIYDDSTNSGFTLYTNLGISNISENVEGLLDLHHISNYMRSYLAAHGAETHNTKDIKGYAGLFGVNYEFDALGVTFNIGDELFLTRNGWVSANSGVAFLDEHSYWAVRDGVENSIYGGINFTKNLRVGTKYTSTFSQSVPKSFSISENVKLQDNYGKDFYLHFQKLEFLINYTF